MNKKFYIARRLLWTLFATWVILTVTFGFLQAQPDPQKAAFISQQLQSGAAENAEQAREAYQRLYGASKSLPGQYADFLVGMVTFDWGWSETRAQPVLDVNWGETFDFESLQRDVGNLDPLGAVAAILPKFYGAIPDAWPYSMMYGVPALVVSTIAGVAIGLYTAVNRNTIQDYSATFFAYFGVSIPDFWFGILMIVIFASGLGWIPIQYQATKGVFTLANLHQLIGPIVVLTFSSMALEMRYSRATALDQINETFVKTAKAQGISWYRLMSRHVLRPALVPLVTILVADVLGLLLVSSYLVEVVFGVPGLGQLSFKAITQSDDRLVLGTILLPTFIALFGNLVQDIAYTVLDPRIEIGEGGE
jgi:peptide/nickel transport system permease protein